MPRKEGASIALTEEERRALRAAIAKDGNRRKFLAAKMGITKGTLDKWLDVEREPGERNVNELALAALHRALGLQERMPRSTRDDTESELLYAFRTIRHHAPERADELFTDITIEAARLRRAAELELRAKLLRSGHDIDDND